MVQSLMGFACRFLAFNTVEWTEQYQVFGEVGFTNGRPVKSGTNARPIQYGEHFPSFKHHNQLPVS